MMVSWKGKMTLRRTLVVAGTLFLLTLSLLSSSYMTNLGTSVYCDYFSVDACKMVPSSSSPGNAAPSPPTLKNVPVLPPVRNHSDAEMSAFVLAKDLLSRPPYPVEKAKIAFMFLTAGPLPFEFVWEKFFEGQEGRYSVYVHASEKQSNQSLWKSSLFRGRDVQAEKVYWGTIEMVDAERRLLANALQDLDNQYFALMSDTCIPLYDFNHIYEYLLGAKMSFVDCFDDPGPHGQGRYMDQMMPEVHRSDWRKGAQWFAITREHALLIVADHLYYNKFKWNCKPGPENRNCYPDEHYITTFLHIVNPGNMANWSVTHVDWSKREWHPKSYAVGDITKRTFLYIQAINEYSHTTSDGKGIKTVKPCLWNGKRRPCFLFARKFLPETADILIPLLPRVIWQRPLHLH